MSENVLTVYIRMARIPVYVLGVCVPRYVKKNTNARQLEITIPLSACGTQGGLTYRTHPSGGGGQKVGIDRQTDRQSLTHNLTVECMVRVFIENTNTQANIDWKSNVVGGRWNEKGQLLVK